MLVCKIVTGFLIFVEVGSEALDMTARAEDELGYMKAEVQMLKESL